MKLEKGQPEEIRDKLKWLMALRVVIVTVVLGSSIILQIGYQRSLHPNSVFYFLIGGTYLLTISYSIAIKSIRNLRRFATLQLVLDLLLETVLIYYTGGIDSPFSLVYMITILSSCVILDRKAGVRTGAVAGILFGTVVDAQYFHLLPEGPANPYPGFETLYLLFLNIGGFIIIAYLTGSLTEKLKQTREVLIERTTGLEDLKAFHQNVLRSISSGVLTTDLKSRITSFNRAAQEITGLSQEEALGRPWWEVLSVDGQRLNIPPAGFPKGSVRLDCDCKRKDGTTLLLGMTVSPLIDSNMEVTGSVWTFQDLTRIKEMEEEVKRKKWLATIGEMAAGIAHEIRNPLASISGTMQVLKREKGLDQDARQMMAIAVTETDRLNSIVSSFLKYARPASLNRKPTDLHKILDETLILLAQTLGLMDRIEIKKRYSEENPVLNIDPDQMKQVFWNLAINALQAMPEGGVLEVATQRVIPRRRSDWVVEMSPDGSWVLIMFKDNGAGIDQEFRDKIFYPFFSMKEKGSGLGLSIVHRIIDDHSGRINVESQKGIGTTMSLLLPMETREEKA